MYGRALAAAGLLAAAAPGLALQFTGPSTQRRPQLRSAAAFTMGFDDFAAFEAEVLAYVAGLDEAALNDPAAPSPLAYAELQRAGRVDLLEGCMEYGGYIKVSQQLGLPVRYAKPIDAPEPVLPGFTKPISATAGLKLSGSQREADMALAIQSLDPRRCLQPDCVSVQRYWSPLRSFVLGTLVWLAVDISSSTKK